MQIKPEITIADFEKVDIRVGRVVDAQDFPEARTPRHKLWIDFGEDVGVKNRLLLWLVLIHPRS